MCAPNVGVNVATRARDLYGKSDPVRGIGSGLSDARLGLRLRYEIGRQFAPYIGVVWTRRFGATASITVVAVLAIRAAGAGVFVYSGLYNIGADDPHTKPVFALLQTLRDRSIQLRSCDIKVPDLQDPQLILKGAGQYAAMCTDCHLNPGMTDSKIRPGLYPQPPNLSQVRLDPRVVFWTIKHGIKMSAMPAWGFSHDDATIWSMVAFVQKLPGMTPAAYKAIVAKAPPDEDMKMPMGMATGEAAGHSHGDAAAPANPSADAMPRRRQRNTRMRMPRRHPTTMPMQRPRARRHCCGRSRHPRPKRWHWRSRPP